MGLRINDIIPNLSIQTDLCALSLHDWIGDSWAILFSHPKDFTPVCTNEFGAVAQLADEWARRGTKFMGISVDGVPEYLRWKTDLNAAGGAKPNFPIVADQDLTHLKAFDMLPAEAWLRETPTLNDTATVQVVYIVRPDKKLKLSMTYPMNVGRNIAEVLRALDALQTANGKGVATPSHRTSGGDVIIPLAVSDEVAKA